jgi:hypothetical protein
MHEVGLRSSVNRSSPANGSYRAFIESREGRSHHTKEASQFEIQVTWHYELHTRGRSGYRGSSITEKDENKVRDNGMHEREVSQWKRDGRIVRAE